MYGVSVDTVDDHREFANEEGLAFDLLADRDGEVADGRSEERRVGKECRL